MRVWGIKKRAISNFDAPGAHRCPVGIPRVRHSLQAHVAADEQDSALKDRLGADRLALI